MMGQTPHLVRLNQKRQFVSRQERDLLSISRRQMALVREIKMGKGEQDWMFARTIVPLKTLQGSAKRIACLHQRPIGNILFGRNGATRSSMQVALTWQLPQTLVEMGIESDYPLWQRQSIFTFPSGPLMVTELFLPSCPIYGAENNNN